MTEQTQPTNTPAAASQAPEETKAATPIEAAETQPNEDAAPALMNGAPKEGESPASPSTWPEDWRTQMSGGNEKLSGILSRFSSPKAVADALLATRQKISSGEYRKNLAEGATPEEVAAYRSENGIPDTPEKYDTNLDGGLVLGEGEKPYVDAFLKDMHSVNAPGPLVKAALQAYAKNVEAIQTQRAEADTNYQRESEDMLRREWGNEYRANLNAASNFLDTQPAGFKNAIMTGRDADGNLLRLNPQVLLALDSLGRQLNPVASVMPGSGANAQQAMESEVETIQKMMGDSNSEYWKGPKDEQGRTKIQARYHQLLTAKERMGN